MSKNNFEDDFQFKPLTEGLGFHKVQKTGGSAQQDLKQFFTQNAFVGDTVTLSEKTVSNQALIKASAAPRLLAWIIDVTLLVAVTAAAFFALRYFVVLKSGWIDQVKFFLAPMFLFYYIFYFSVFEKACQKTLGKKIVSLKVVREFNGQSASFVQTFFRAIFSLFNLATCGLWSVAGLGELLTRTKVVVLKNDDF